MSSSYHMTILHIKPFLFQCSSSLSAFTTAILLRIKQSSTGVRCRGQLKGQNTISCTYQSLSRGKSRPQKFRESRLLAMYYIERTQAEWESPVLFVTNKAALFAVPSIIESETKHWYGNCACDCAWTNVSIRLGKLKYCNSWHELQILTNPNRWSRPQKMVLHFIKAITDFHACILGSNSRWMPQGVEDISLSETKWKLAIEYLDYIVTSLQIRGRHMDYEWEALMFPYNFVVTLKLNKWKLRIIYMDFIENVNTHGPSKLWTIAPICRHAQLENMINQRPFLVFVLVFSNLVSLASIPALIEQKAQQKSTNEISLIDWRREKFPAGPEKKVI